MSKTTNETVQSMQHLDSLKAVKVAMDMNKAQDKTIDMIVNLVGTMDKNMKLLATKVLELEKKIEGLEGYANREV
jgi:tryptophan synthase beta subunit